MADAVPDSYAYFTASGMPKLLVALAEVQGLAIDKGLVPLAKEIGAVIQQLLRDVNECAVQMAAYADEKIIARIHATQSANRPHTGEMETHVASKPGELGLVNVALIDELNKIINERGYGPFWRAQEYGTGTSEVPSQEGRVLFGTFEPSETPPDANQRGLGQGRDLAFVPGGASPGFGTINYELPGRHFLRDGATEAGERYIQRMNEIRDRAQQRFLKAMEDFKRGRLQPSRTITMRIDA